MPTTVKEFIQQLLDECDGRDPATVEIATLTYDPTWGYEYDNYAPVIESRGGNQYPFEVVIKV